jgi:hypothetical protein
MGGHAAGKREIKITYKIFVWKPEGKTPIGRPKCRCEYKLKWLVYWVGICGLN